MHRKHIEMPRLDPTQEVLVVVPHPDPFTPDQLVVGRKGGRNLGGLWCAMEQGTEYAVATAVAVVGETKLALLFEHGLGGAPSRGRGASWGAAQNVGESLASTPQLLTDFDSRHVRYMRLPPMVSQASASRP